MTRLILSRKGFDSTAGGRPSPILPDGRLPSLPIPEDGTGVRYTDLRFDSRGTYADVMAEAGITSIRMPSGARRPVAGAEAHLDPDLAPRTRPRPAGWRPAFGQAGAAQTVLQRAGVGVGDLFLFFGWFRAVSGGPHLHVIWGWLRVGAILTPPFTARWLAGHPHAVLPDRTNNTVYVAADTAFPGVPGAGVLPFASRRALTAPDAKRRADWRLPAVLHPDATTVLARHRRRFGPVDGDWARFDARYQWQEFVAESGPGVEQWAAGLLSP